MKTLTIGLAAPGLLVIVLVADAGSRFLSYDLVAFRGYESLRRGGTPGLGGPFARDRTYRNARAYGDLASIGNAPNLRQYRPEVMTTDEWGFRNRPGTAAREIDAVLFGTSFTEGAGLSDGETLSDQLAAALAFPVYNAAGLDIGRERAHTWLVSRLRFRRRVAIVEHMEAAPQGIWAGSGRTLGMRVEDRWGASHPGFWRGYAYLKEWTNESPLRLTIFKMFKCLQNDVVLPNEFSDRVVRDQLTNGDPILFLPTQVAPQRAPTAVTDEVGFWTRLDAFLRERNFTLVVVLVPSQYRVYGPLVQHPSPVAARDTFLDDLEQALRAAGVSVVNPTQQLMDAARDGLAAHRYVYWRDDTHWNPAGVAIAAREIARQLTRVAGTAPTSDR